MLAELVRELVGLGRSSTGVEFHTTPECPTKVWVQHGDVLEEIEVQPPLRRHRLAGFHDLVAALKDPAIAPAPEVFVAKDRVAVLLDRSKRHEVVDVVLTETKRLQLCMDLEARPRSMQPKDAVKMLRLELHSGNHQHVIDALSNLDFQRTSDGRSQVGHGKESLGKSVEARVQQADKVPEKFTVGCPVWTTTGFTRYGVTIEFGVFLNPEAMTVELRVLSDEIERVRNLALGDVANDLREALEGKVPVFLGTP